MGLPDCFLGTYLYRTLHCVVGLGVRLALRAVQTCLALDTTMYWFAGQFFLIGFHICPKKTGYWVPNKLDCQLSPEYAYVALRLMSDI